MSDNAILAAMRRMGILAWLAGAREYQRGEAQGTAHRLFSGFRLESNEQRHGNHA